MKAKLCSEDLPMLCRIWQHFQGSADLKFAPSAAHALTELPRRPIENVVGLESRISGIAHTGF